MRIKHAMFAIAIAAVAFTATSASAFEFHGYLRAAGFGINTKGGGQVCFQAPNTEFKFRLGNECENYGELEFNESLYKDKNGVEFKYVGMLAYSTSDGQDFENIGGSIALRQNWVGAKLPQLGNATIWLGKRYFHRNDDHIIDFFYFDPSGPGVGIEDVDLGFGKLAFTIFSSGGDDGNGNRVQLGNGARDILRPEVRVYGIPVNPGGSLEVAVSLSLVLDQSTTQQNPVGETRAVASPWFTIQHLQTNLFGGFNKLAFQYATGSIASMNGYTDNAASSAAKQWRIVEMLQFQPVPEFSGMLTFVYQDKTKVYENPGYAGQSLTTWSAGIRPVYHVNDYFKFQVEFGYQSSKTKGQNGGADGPTQSLWKVTAAPTLVAGGNFWSRPELRLFVTYAAWNDATKGTQPAPFATESSGITAGAQLEAWW